jgi:hypothetical protein
MTIRDRALALVVAAFVLGAADARAASPEMLKLFEQGRSLVKEGKCDEAIPKFLDAIAIEPSVGALLNLGDCYEKTGKPTIARKRFLEAAALAGEGDPARFSEAKSRAARLDSQIAVVAFARRYEADVAEPRITIDGEAVPPRAERLELDPGRHEVVVKFSDRAAQPETITLRAGETLRFALVPPTAEAPPPQPPPREEPGGMGAMKWAALGVGGAGVVGVGIGAVFGVVAIGKRSDLDATCPGYPHCAESQRPDVQQKYDDAKTAATTSTICFVAGGALVATGVVLWLLSPDKAAPTTSGLAVRW